MPGISEYTHASALINIHFPKGKEVCRYCPMCVSDPRNHKRESCLLTGEILPFADLGIDKSCPLEFKED